MLNTQTMHPRIAELARELLPLMENPPAKFTKRDRDKLVVLRNKIKGLCNEPGIQLSNSDDMDRHYLYVESTRLANQQEDFYENNGNKWEPIAYKNMTDDEAKAAIRSCIRPRLRTGVAIADIHTALEEEVGVTGVALDIHPKPVDGRLPKIGRDRFEFQFMAHGPSRATI